MESTVLDPFINPANGVSLGDMQAKLLQKVEELTLYVIALDGENRALRERIDALEEGRQP